MPGMKRLLTVLLASLPAAAAAQPDGDFCADLRRAMATQTEPGSYRPGWQAPSYYLFERCSAFREGFDDRVTCTWRPPAAEPAEELAAAVERCLPTARRLPAAESGNEQIQLNYELRIITVARQGNEARLTVAIPEG